MRRVSAFLLALLVLALGGCGRTEALDPAAATAGELGATASPEARAAAAAEAALPDAPALRALLDDVDAAQELAAQCDEATLTLAAESLRREAGAALGALRLCVEARLGLAPAELRPSAGCVDWDAVRSLSLAGPYADYFEALSLELAGTDPEHAAALYERAAVFGDGWADAEGFSFLGELDAAALAALRAALLTAEDALYARWWPEPLTPPGTAADFLPDVHRALGEACLAEGNPAGAAGHYRNLILLTPFESGGYLLAATACLSGGDCPGAGRYLDEGLLLAPDDCGLNSLAALTALAAGREDAAADYLAAARACPGAEGFAALHGNLEAALSGGETALLYPATPEEVALTDEDIDVIVAALEELWG